MAGIVNKHIYSARCFEQAPFGAGHQFAEHPGFLQALSGVDSRTARLLRFQPDTALIRKTLSNPHRPRRVLLVEEKVMESGLDSLYDIPDRLGLGCDDLYVEEVGGCDYEAWKVYSALSTVADVALVIYCVWLPAKLFMDWVNPRTQFLERRRVRRTVAGSRNPIARLHMRHFKTMAQFLVQDLELNPLAVRPMVEKCIPALNRAFRLEEDDWSPEDQFAGISMS